MAVFDWMEKAREEVNGSEEYRQFGSSDVRVAFKGGKSCNLVNFDAFEVKEITEIDPDRPFPIADVVIEMPVRSWNSYMRKRAIHQSESIQSLNLSTAKEVIRSENPVGRLKFDRFQLSIQRFIDTGAQVRARSANL